MRALWLLVLLPPAGCASGPEPLFVDRERPSRAEAAEQERRAREAIRDVERRVERGDLPKIQFEFDKDEITPESYPTLELIATILLENSKLKVFVLAHTDSVGTEEYNQDLSERRAKSVKGFLAKRGVPPPSIRYKGFGFSRPLADNSTDEGRAKNRRVEFRVTSRDWPSVY